MNRKFKVTRNVTITSGHFVNTETGETLESEYLSKGINPIERVTTAESVLKSNDFITIDYSVIDYLLETLSDSDIRRLLDVGRDVSSKFSVLVQENNTPHTTATLIQKIDLDRAQFYKWLRRMVKAGVIAYVVCAPSGFIQKIYMLNPYVMRKRKTFNNAVFQIFSDPRATYNQP